MTITNGAAFTRPKPQRITPIICPSCHRELSELGIPYETDMRGDFLIRYRAHTGLHGILPRVDTTTIVQDIRQNTTPPTLYADPTCRFVDRAPGTLICAHCQTELPDHGYSIRFP